MRYFSRLFLIAGATALMTGCIGIRIGHVAPPLKKLDLQAILDSASDNSILTIDYGQYVLQDGLTVNGRSNLTITAPRGTCIFVDDVMQDVIAFEDCDSVHVMNLHMRHVKPLTDYQCEGAVIRMSACHDMRVTNCELDGCGAFGVACDDVSGLAVTDCYIHNNTYSALYFNDCEDALITGNRIVHNADLITQYSCSGIELRDNQLK